MPRSNSDKLLAFDAAEIEERFFPRDTKRECSRAPHELQPLADLREMLFDCDVYENRGAGLSYEKWHKTGAAVHKEYFGSDLEDAAFEIFLEWSEQMDRHKLSWLEHCWDHYRADRPNGVGLGTLLWETRHERAQLLGNRIVKEMMRDERDQEEIEEEDRDPKGYAARKKAERESNWLNKLIRAPGSGQALTVVENLVAVLQYHPIFEARLGFCEFNHVVSWRIPDDEDSGLNRNELQNKLSDEQRSKIRAHLSHIYTKNRGISIPYDDKSDYLVIQSIFRVLGMPVFKKPDIDAAVALVSRKRSFNPLEDMLTEVEWDGRPRMDQFFQKCFGADDTPYVRAASECFWIIYALRILYPGAQWDCVFVVCSPQQGIGKSKTFEICATWKKMSLFSDAPFDMSDAKLTGEALQRRLVVEVGEGVALSKYNVADLKACITRTTDRFRPPWGRRTEDVPRIGQMVITQNHDRLPPDNTGNRRYIVVFCGDPGEGFERGMLPGFEWSWRDLVRNLPQLRAEAYVRALAVLRECEETGLTPAVTFPRHVIQELRAIQADQTATNRAREWADEVRNFFEEPVAADTLFDTGRVPEKYHGKMVRRLRTTMKEFFYDYLGRPNHEDYLRQSNIDDMTAAFHVYGKCERKNGVRHLGVSSNVWRIKGTSDWLEIVDEEERASDDGVRSRRKNVIDFVDERGKRDRRD